MLDSALFYVISDLNVYQKLESLFPETILGQACAFLGSTFADKKPWKPGEKSSLLPTSRLLYRWSLMNEMSERVYIPAIKSGKFFVVFVHELGREAYHYAIRHHDCVQTLRFHESLVKARLVDQGGKPPEYYLSRRPTDSRLIKADADYFDNPQQQMRYYEATTVEGQVDESLAFLQCEFAARLKQRQAA